MSVTIQFSCLVTRTKYAVIHRDTTLSIFQNIMHIMLKYLFQSCKYILFNSKVSLQFVTSTFKSIFTTLIHINNTNKYNICLQKFEAPSFLVFGHFWQWSYKNAKILRNLYSHFARQDGLDGKKQEESHATKMIKIPKTKRQKMGWTKKGLILKR